ncbi:hypothetical protein BpHYR1_023501 [Brachionus plicatilis]|uniref:Uncharacterized protein n=1 Tax=Brachionus plicatilis TaxID=10195 RepID=A0A3M7Q7B9_BRAPC|nr:hypothetical protein BpHYR1_023501 [Brachionus plicatilis]
MKLNPTGQHIVFLKKRFILKSGSHHSEATYCLAPQLVCCSLLLLISNQILLRQNVEDRTSYLVKVVQIAWLRAVLRDDAAIESIEEGALVATVRMNGWMMLNVWMLGCFGSIDRVVARGRCKVA